MRIPVLETVLMIAALAGGVAGQDGPFFAKLPQPTPATAAVVRVGDMNEDGLLDLVVSTLPSEPIPAKGISVLLAIPGGGFAPAGFAATRSGDVPVFELADLDDDGHLDVLAPGFGVLLGRGDGSLGLPMPVLEDPLLVFFEPHGVALADFNADGDLDFATVTVVGVQIGFGRGDGTFDLARLLEAAPHASHQSVIAADLVEDGDPDLLVGADVDLFSSGLWLVASDGAGGFLPPRLVLGGVLHSTIAAVADFDGDGHLDIATFANGFAGPGGARVGVSLGNGNGDFEPAVTTPVPGWLGDVSNSTALFAADFDADGRPDLVLTRGSKLLGPSGPFVPVIAVLGGLGDGRFERADLFATGTTILSDVDIADIDGNGMLDIAVPLGETHEVALMLNGETPFIDIGFSHPGGLLAPSLTASGVPAAGQVVVFQVHDAPPGVNGLLFFGTEAALQPFHGGTLVPGALSAVPLGPGRVVPLSWPARIVAGTTGYGQAWFATPGPFVASNALGIVAQ